MVFVLSVPQTIRSLFDCFGESSRIGLRIGSCVFDTVLIVVGVSCVFSGFSASFFVSICVLFYFSHFSFLFLSRVFIVFEISVFGGASLEDRSGSVLSLMFPASVSGFGGFSFAFVSGIGSARCVSSSFLRLFWLFAFCCFYFGVVFESVPSPLPLCWVPFCDHSRFGRDLLLGFLSCRFYELPHVVPLYGVRSPVV